MLVAPFSSHCKFCSPMTRLGCRIAALGVGVMVIVGLLVRTELASRGRVWTMAGRGWEDGVARLGAERLGLWTSVDSASVRRQL